MGFSFAPVKSGTRENAALFKLCTRGHFSRALQVKPSYPLSWVHDNDTLFRAYPDSSRKERNVMCVFRNSERLWGAMRQSAKIQW